MTGKADESFTITYKFKFHDGKESVFAMDMNRENLALKITAKQPYPDWAKLEFHKCPNCLLDERLDPYCPAALALLEPMERFREAVSYEEADVEVASPGRLYSKHTTLQEGLSAMVGLRMATSGCPVMERLRPMVKFHLPFASSEETMYRVLSMYLFAQYIIYKRKGQPDWDMKYLATMYDRIREVNKNIVTRLQNIAVKDASLNALINLDCFAISVKFSINLELLEEVEYLFAGYM